jgi:hydroxymethylglutaryl-CoA lyase
MALPQRVTLVDVGPRDGLQNEKQTVPAEIKIGLVQRLQDAGLTEIEVTSYVSPKWVPQMADNAQVMSGIPRKPGVRYSVLTPNCRVSRPPWRWTAPSGPTRSSCSAPPARPSASATSTARLPRASSVSARWRQAARDKGIFVRGAMSCTVGCPYEGDVAPERVEMLAG